MPTGKDLKRLVRARMKKTGESYTAARVQLLNKRTTRAVRLKAETTGVGFSRTADYAELAGMSDASVKKATGCTWERWVRSLDKWGAATKSHREIAAMVSKFGAPDWWTQMVTVGYERIKGLRDKGQRRDGGYEASKSRTFDVAVSRVYDAFRNDRTRTRWLDKQVTVKSATAPKRMRLAWPDGTSAVVGFVAKGPAKSLVAIQHEKLPDRAAIEAMKKEWGDAFERLSDLVTS
jgi:hypothetical protein